MSESITIKMTDVTCEMEVSGVIYESKYDFWISAEDVALAISGDSSVALNFIKEVLNRLPAEMANEIAYQLSENFQ